MHTHTNARIPVLSILQWSYKQNSLPIKSVNVTSKQACPSSLGAKNSRQYKESIAIFLLFRVDGRSGGGRGEKAHGP